MKYNEPYNYVNIQVLEIYVCTMHYAHHSNFFVDVHFVGQI